MSLPSDLLSIPAFLFFQFTWIIHSLRRPFLLVSALCILSNPTAAIRKSKLFYISILYLVFCKDKKWKVPKDTDPASFFPKDLGGTATSSGGNKNNKYREKTIILIRHGESTWNDTFNAGDRSKAIFVLFFVPNLIYAIAMETYYFISGKDSDSWFFDSPLSAKGVGQGEGLRKFLKKEKMRLGSSASAEGQGEERAIKLMLALGEEGNPSSHVVSSNLRRAISTAAIGLADRFVATVVSKGGTKNSNNDNDNDEILIIPSMQEISRNPDALTILPSRGTSHPTWCDDDISGLPPGTFTKLIDSQFHTGNKSLDSNGLIRLTAFCNDLFDQHKLPKDAVVAAGHSLFFRSFFQVLLPRGMEHISKKKKLVNGGTVMVTLREVTLADGSGKKEYMIDPRSIVVVYGGFGKHTKG